MTPRAILDAVAQAGGRLIRKGDTLVMQAPAPLPDALQQAIRQHKAELLALLAAQDAAPDTDKPPLGKIGRHGKPCPDCGETWQWPTTSGGWCCSWCVCAGPETPKVAPGTTPAPEAGYSYCPGCGATTLERQGEQTTCTTCQAFWLPSVDLCADAPTPPFARTIRMDKS